jgi:hypothetical protein
VRSQNVLLRTRVLGLEPLVLVLDVALARGRVLALARQARVLFL